MGDLGQIARAVGRDDGGGRARPFDRDARQAAFRTGLPAGEAALLQELGDALIERGHAVVVEARRDGAVNRHGVGRHAEGLAIALDLLPDVAQRVLGALAVELVDRDQIGEVEHVDLLELARRAELGRHDVERDVDMGHDGGVALPYPRGLDDDQVEAGSLARGDRVGQAGGDLAARAAGRERAHEHGPAVERVHPDAVAEQGAAALAPRRVDGNERDRDVGPVEAEAAQDLVGQRRLAGAAGARDAEHGHAARRPAVVQRLARRLADLAGLEPRDKPRQIEASLRLGRRFFERRKIARQIFAEIAVGARQHVVDHALQTEALAVARSVKARDAIGLQLGDLLGHDHAAAAAEDADVRPAALAQQVDHVFEVLDMAALVGADRDGVGVLLDRGRHHVVDRAVMAEMDDLGARRLEDAAHDVDRGVVAVEQRGRRDEAQAVLGLVAFLMALGCADAIVGHGFLQRVGRSRERAPPFRAV